MFWFFDHKAILVQRPEMEPATLASEDEDLTTRSPQKSLDRWFELSPSASKPTLCNRWISLLPFPFHRNWPRTDLIKLYWFHFQGKILPPTKICMPAKLIQSCPTLYGPMDYSPSGSSAHVILQARILEWVAMPSSGELPDLGIKPSSLMSLTLAAKFFTTSTTWEAPLPRY